MTETVVGYTGGSIEWPTYKSIGDHTEALRVAFDPNLISVEQLLKVFWAEHQPMPMAFTGSQYRSAVYYHTEEQRLIAERLRAQIKPTLSKHTALQAAGDFYRGEEYHQKWIAKQSRARAGGVFL